MNVSQRDLIRFAQEFGSKIELAWQNGGSCPRPRSWVYRIADADQYETTVSPRNKEAFETKLRALGLLEVGL